MARFIPDMVQDGPAKRPMIEISRLGGIQHGLSSRNLGRSCQIKVNVRGVVVFFSSAGNGLADISIP